MRRNDGIELVRLFAIFSVVVAHFKPSPLEAGSPVYIAIMHVLGTVGIPVFFSLSGYLFKVKQDISFLTSVWQRRYLIPWLFCSVITYGLYAVATDRFSLAEYGRFLLGFSSPYYFLTLLLLYEVIARLASRVRAWRVILFCIALTGGVISTSLVTWTAGRTEGGIFGLPRVATYLNPLSFFVYYCFGLILQEEKVRQRVIRLGLVFGFVALLCAVLKSLETYRLISAGRMWLGYFSPLMILLGLSLSACLFSTCVFRTQYPAALNRFASWGRYVLAIYLLHFAAVGAFKRIFARLEIAMIPWHLAAVVAILLLVGFGVYLTSRLLPRAFSKYVYGL